MNEKSAVDCPHRQQLEHTLLHCQTQSEILQATRDNYLSIIDEFKRDLEELTEQVEQQQETNQSCPEPELHIEEPPRINCELEIQNERLACQIEGLQDTVKSRDGQIAELQAMIHSYSDFSENNRLKEQIHELRQKNSDQSRQIRELVGADRNNEKERTELVCKYQDLMQSLEEKCQRLKGAERRVESLQARLNQSDHLQDELKIERNMLRDEVVALKEKEAVSTGRERALIDQQRHAHMELEKTRHLVREMQGQLLLEESQHRENAQKLELAKDAIREEVRKLAADCQQLHIRLKQQADVNQQQEQLLESFRKWKEAQVRSDDAMRQCAKESEDKINQLLDENQELSEDYRNIYRDYQVLESEMQRIKLAFNYTPVPSMGYPPQSGGGRMDPQEGNDMDRRMQSMASTSQRVFNQYRTLDDVQSYGPKPQIKSYPRPSNDKRNTC